MVVSCSSQLLGEPASGVVRYGNAASKSPAPTVAPSVYGKLPVGRIGRHTAERRRIVERAEHAHRRAQLDVDDVVAGPAAVREAGRVAAEHAEVRLHAGAPSPRCSCSGAASRPAPTASRASSGPGCPSGTRRRGRCAGSCSALARRARRTTPRAARAAPDSSRRSGTADRAPGRLALKRSLSRRPMTTSLTSGLPSRDTCVSAPPSTDAFVRPRSASNVGAGFSTLTCGKLAVVQPPMTGSLPSVRHEIGTSRISDVTFLSSMMLSSPFGASDGVRVHEIEHLAEVHGERLLALADEQLARLATRNASRCRRGSRAYAA